MNIFIRFYFSRYFFPSSVAYRRYTQPVSLIRKENNFYYFSDQYVKNMYRQGQNKFSYRNFKFSTVFFTKNSYFDFSYLQFYDINVVKSTIILLLRARMYTMYKKIYHPTYLFINQK